MNIALNEYMSKLREVEFTMNTLRSDLRDLDASGKESLFSNEINFFTVSNKILSNITKLDHDLSILFFKISNLDTNMSSFKDRRDRDFILGRRGSLMDRITRTRNSLRKLKTQYRNIAKTTDRISTRSLTHQTLSNANEPKIDSPIHELGFDVVLGVLMMGVLMIKKYKK